MTRILEVSVLAQLQDEAPKVMVPSYEGHKAVVKALVMWSSAQPVSGTDEQGKTYWIAALHELAPLTGMDIPAQHMGRACRSFCLVMKREDDGYRVAWSKQQLEILRKEFNMLGESK